MENGASPTHSCGFDSDFAGQAKIILGPHRVMKADERGASMKKQSLQVVGSFSGEGDVQQILIQSFRLYLNRILAQRHGGTV